jgi:hypothetical protein
MAPPPGSVGQAANFLRHAVLVDGIADGLADGMKNAALGGGAEGEELCQFRWFRARRFGMRDEGQQAGSGSKEFSHAGKYDVFRLEVARGPLHERGSPTLAGRGRAGVFIY